MRARIRLDTTTDIANFILAVNTLPDDVKVFIKNTDSSLSIDGKSFLGVAHAAEFDELWCTCERDIWSIIEPFVMI